MGFDDDYSAVVVPCLMEEFGVEVIYHPPDGSDDVTLTAIREADGTEPPNTVGGSTRERQVLELSITADPASEYGGVAQPSERATVTYDSEEWAVESIPKRAPPLWRLRLVRIGTSEVARDGYRRQR